MNLRVLRVVAMAGSLAIAAACSRDNPSFQSAPTIQLITLSSGVGVVEVTGLSRDALAVLASRKLTPEDWSALFRVTVGPEDPAMLGEYQVVKGALRFTPAFPLDPGRPYHVHFAPGFLPSRNSLGEPPILATVTLPARNATPTTFVAQIHPTGDEVPENQLRLYIEFSAPMGRRSGIAQIQLLDAHGAPVPAPFLPLDYEFWNPDHTRFTVFFDPGRVKRGILPNTQMGRALRAGRQYTLVISEQWRDANGLPLTAAFRKTFRAGPADEAPLDPSRWHIEAPVRAGRDPLVVTFPEPLDHGLLMRALGVRRDGMLLEGDTRSDAADTRWVFTPRQTWLGGRYELIVLSILEDLAGNRIGRAFEVDEFDVVDEEPSPETIALPFTIQ